MESNRLTGSNTSSLILRPYQKEAVEKAYAAKRATIKAPTGTGKTIIAIAWLEKVQRDSLIIVPTQALIYQVWSPRLEEYGFEDVGQFYAFAKKFGPVTVTTFASATAHPQLLDSAEAVVVDEIHHLGAYTALTRLLPKLKQKEYVLGLSSVPERPDKTHEVFLKEFPICYDLGLGTALKSGYVSPIQVIDMKAPMTQSERAMYEMLTAKIQKAFRFCGPDISKWARCFDPKSRQYIGKQGVWAMSRRKKLLSDIESKRDLVLKILQTHPGQRIILFSESVPAIENIKNYLVERGVTCETFHAATEPWRRQEILEEWGNKFQVLLSCRALEEGLDVKEVSIGILITSGRSKRQFIQRIGRVIRPMEGKEAKFYVVFSPDTVEETYSKTIANLLRSA